MAPVKRFGESQNKQFVLLAKSYVLGEKILDVDFKNRIVDSIIATRFEAYEDSFVHCPKLSCCGHRLRKNPMIVSGLTRDGKAVGKRRSVMN
jgi:hypothetical protein